MRRKRIVRMEGDGFEFLKSGCGINSGENGKLGHGTRDYTTEIALFQAKSASIQMKLQRHD